MGHAKFITSLLLALTLCCEAHAATGLDKNGQLQALVKSDATGFAFTRLQNGVQFRVRMDGTEVEVGSACHDPAEVECDIKGLGVQRQVVVQG